MYNFPLRDLGTWCTSITTLIARYRVVSRNNVTC